MAIAEASFADRLRAAATALTGSGETPDTADLLRTLGYDDGDADAATGRIRMLRAASLGPHNAGLPVGGFAGSGLNPRRAFESCVGEGVEYLSQFAQPDDPLQSGAFEAHADALDPGTHRFVAAVLAACGVAVDQAIDWTPVRRLADGTPSWFPADLCVRRAAPNFIPPMKLSTGCAAGVTRDAATLRGMLELIERDAVALWWRGGRRPRSIAVDSETATLLERVRAGQGGRQTTLLDITTDLGVPVVAAFSTRPDGYGFALGMAARTDFADAARSAIFEMCQSELSLRVIAAKQRESGQAALNESDLQQQTRASSLNPNTCVLLQPNDAVPPPPLSGNTVEAITQRLAERGIVAWSLDLTRAAFEVPVVRVIAPGLQSEPSEITSDRLARAIAETGGGAQYSGGVVLL
jgi:ribosomal protein S12 methylthiotransferase accessory factor